MRTKATWFAVLPLFLLLVSCGGDDDPANPGSENPADIPAITSVDPANLTEGISTLVHGENFGDSGQLFLNDAEVATSIWTDTLLNFTVPQGIYGTQVDLMVRSGGKESVVFQVAFFEATERQLTFDGLSCSAPCWSQDGSHIYFQAQGPGGTSAFYAVPFDGGETTLLYDSVGNDYMLDVHFQNGNLLWINDENLASGNPDGDWEVWEGGPGFNPRGYAVYDHLTNNSNERWPAWNHNIQYGVPYAWARDGQGGNSHVFIQRATQAELLVAGMMPRFRAGDGDRLAYLTERGVGDGYDINVISLAPGAEGEQVYGGQDVTISGLDWSTGGLICYIHNPGNNVWVMNEDGTNHRAVTTSTATEYQPRFSPSGQWVAFIRHVTTEGEVFVARVP